MLDLIGITEIVGESGSGKTKLALSVNSTLKTMYLSIDSSGTPHLLPNVIPIKIKTFLELKVFISKDLRRAVKTLNIKKIVLDGLENYLYEFRQPRKEYNGIFRIIKILKHLCFVKDVQVIVINSSFGLWENSNVKIPNKYFGLPWEYMINSRYLVTKHVGYRSFTRVDKDGIPPVKFTLSDYSADLVVESLQP